MQKLNEVLPPLQEKFEQHLGEGKLLALEPGSAGAEFLDELLEAVRAEAENG